MLFRTTFVINTGLLKFIVSRFQSSHTKNEELKFFSRTLYTRFQSVRRAVGMGSKKVTQGQPTIRWCTFPIHMSAVKILEPDCYEYRPNWCSQCFIGLKLFRKYHTNTVWKYMNMVWYQQTFPGYRKASKWRRCAIFDRRSWNKIRWNLEENSLYLKFKQRNKKDIVVAMYVVK